MIRSTLLIALNKNQKRAMELQISHTIQTKHSQSHLLCFRCDNASARAILFSVYC